MSNPRTAERRRVRRQELLDAAHSVFGERGYFDTRVADIVAAAGVSQGTFYLYFDSKDDVLRALLDVLVEDLYAASVRPLRPQLGTEASLRATLRQFLDAYRDRAALIRIMEQVATFHAGFLATRLATKERFTSLIEAGVRAAQAGQPSQRRLDPHYTALALGAMVEDVAYGRYVLAAPLDEDLAVDTMTAIWMSAIGLGREHPAPQEHPEHQEH